MKNLGLFTLLFLLAFSMNAQITEKEDDLKKSAIDTVEGWKTKAVFNLNIAQVSLKNWSAGGQNSFALNSLASFSADYDKGNSSWENQLDLGYGLLRQGKDDNVITQKTDDKIDFSSKYGQKATDKLYYAALLNFKTQFTDGYDYEISNSVPISKLMAPGYLLGAVGFDYKPKSNLSIFFAPLTSKTTFVLDDSLANMGAFGVEPATYDDAGTMLTAGENTRFEFGGYVKVAYKTDLMENVNLQTKLDLFSNYLDNPQNIDVSWDVLLNMKVNKYITVSINTLLLYDDDVKFEFDNDNDGVIDEKGPRIQFKELFGIGFSYTL